MAPTTEEVAIVDPDGAGAEIYKKATCITCHAADLKGQGGPSLRGIGDAHSKEELLGIIHDGIGGMGPQYDANIAKGLTDKDIDTLADWLASQKTAE